MYIYVRMIGYSVFKSFDVSRLYVDDPLLLAIARNRRYGWHGNASLKTTFLISLIVNNMTSVRDE